MRGATTEESRTVDNLSVDVEMDFTKQIEQLEKIKSLLTEIKQLKAEIFGEQGNDGISYKDVFNATRKANEEYKAKSTPSAFI